MSQGGKETRNGEGNAHREGGGEELEEGGGREREGVERKEGGMGRGELEREKETVRVE